MLKLFDKMLQIAFISWYCFCSLNSVNKVISMTSLKNDYKKEFLHSAFTILFLQYSVIPSQIFIKTKSSYA